MHRYGIQSEVALHIIMHGWVLLLFTSFLTLILANSIVQSFEGDSYDRSCSPCGEKYIVTGISELLEDIARKCGYDETTLKKYNPNAHHILEKGSVISFPCPLEKYPIISAANYVDEYVPFSSSHRQEKKITVLEPNTDPGTSTRTSYDSPGFVGCGICGISYEPNNGDTLESVAEYCNTTVASLKKENKNISNDNISSFQAINISCTGTDHINNCSICGSWHHVQMSETLYMVASKCNITLKVLEQANLGIDFNNIFPGQYINVPCKNPNLLVPLDHCGSCGIKYIARQAVDIIEISRNRSVGVADLQNLNPSLKGLNSTVPMGNTLRLPCGQGFCGPCGSQYTYLKSESLTHVSSMCHVGTIDLQLENKGIKFPLIPNNTVLNLPCNNSTKQSPPCSKCSPNIQVENDTDVSGVSKLCNVSSDVILYANNIISEIQVIPKGQIVHVPCASVPSQTLRTCTLCGASIMLQAFVKLDALAVLCNTTASAIVDVNPKGLVLDQPGVGDTLILPCNSYNWGCGPCGNSYVVTDEGESLESVAVKCATMAQDIQISNPNINFTQSLAVNTVIDIPCSFSDLTSGSGTCATCFKLVPWHNGLAKFLFSIFLLVF